MWHTPCLLFSSEIWLSGWSPKLEKVWSPKTQNKNLQFINKSSELQLKKPNLLSECSFYCKMSEVVGTIAKKSAPYNKTLKLLLCNRIPSSSVNCQKANFNNASEGFSFLHTLTCNWDESILSSQMDKMALFITELIGSYECCMFSRANKRWKNQMFPKDWCQVLNSSLLVFFFLVVAWPSSCNLG